MLSDIHQSEHKWSLLTEACKIEKPDIVMISGDLFFRSYYKKIPLFVEHKMVKNCEKIKEFCKEVIFIMGNDDPKEYQALLKKETKLWKCIDNDVVYLDIPELKDVAFCGIPQVMDYPFRYKDWIVRDTSSDSRYCFYQNGLPMTYYLDDFRELKVSSWEEELMKRPTMETVISDLYPKIKDIRKSIWLIHNPPMGCGLDSCASGEFVGSRAVLNFITSKQPILTLHGHIHESPQRTNKWYVDVGDTCVVQAGQIGGKLHYAVAEYENGKIMNIRHSIWPKKESP